LISVLWPIRQPFSHFTVFTAPQRTASGVSSSNSGITSCLCGIVTLNPRKLLRRISTALRSCLGLIRRLMYNRSSPPSISKILLCITGDKLCPIGSPITAKSWGNTSPAFVRLDELAEGSQNIRQSLAGTSGHKQAVRHVVEGVGHASVAW